MEASNVTPSFLCFLPELQCAPTDIIYFNGINESNGIQHFSTKPLPLAKKNGLNGTLDSPNRLLNASAEAGSGIGNGFLENRVSLSGSHCQRELLKIGNMEESRGDHQQPDLATRTVLQSFNQAESGNVQAAERNGHYHPSQEFSGEEDELAFEITEFFDAFQDGKERIFMKLREKLDSLSPDSSLDPRGNQLGALPNAKSRDGQSSFGKPGMPVDEDSTHGGLYQRWSSADRSEKWNGLLEVDSLSATFSGPISLSGYSGHTPYSGSVSHRSDSSTASTHSFAFPILPCEWNSSPVKMPEPDQRFTEKGWKQHLRNFFCCSDYNSAKAHS